MERRLSALSLVLALASSAWAEPRVELQGRARQPGEVLLIAVEDHDPARPPSGRFRGSALQFFKASSGTYLAFAGLDLETSTGPARLELDLYAPGAAARPWSQEVVVEPKDFPTETLEVDDKYVEPKKADAERAARDSLRLKALYAAASPKRLFTGSFLSPIPDAPAAHFGARRVFNGVPKAPHGGADLHARTGAPVRAPAGGKVVLADSLFYSGNTVILDHGGGLFTGYFHLSKISVKKGRKVARGDLLGKVGATGRVTGPHLHWMAKLRGARIDPFSLTALDLDSWLGSR